MEKEIFEQLVILTQSIEQMEECLVQRMDEKIRESEGRMMEKIRESETRTKIYIENAVTRRLDALTDGYKSVHEKQWELEHENEKMRAKIEDLQVRMAVLESKLA